jgi:hypothetical protein
MNTSAYFSAGILIGIVIGFIFTIGCYYNTEVGDVNFEQVGNNIYVKWHYPLKEGYYKVDTSQKYEFKNHIMLETKKQ